MKNSRYHFETQHTGETIESEWYSVVGEIISFDGTDFEVTKQWLEMTKDGTLLTHYKCVSVDIKNHILKCPDCSADLKYNGTSLQFVKHN